MIKRLNFLWSENIDEIDEKLDVTVGNYKDVLDYAVTKTLAPTEFLKPGPYLGVVLRVDDPETGTNNPMITLGSWISENYGEGSTTESPVPEPILGYKVRIPEFDAAIPEPPTICKNIQEDSDAQKYIEMHTTFIATPSADKAEAGQVVWVDFDDYKLRTRPTFLGPYFNGKGETISISPEDITQGPKAAFDKCASWLRGDPDGSGLKKLHNQYRGGMNNSFLGPIENQTIESDEKVSEAPKNTYPRDCSLETSRNVDNTPDNKKEEDNLKFLEEEVIPRLLPVIREADPRFIITSVYRSDELNKKVGGHPNSFHAKGLAIDFGGLSHLQKDERDKVFMKALDHLKKNKNQLPWLRTVIAELFRNHIHVDVYPQPQTGVTRWRTWKLKNLALEKF